VLLNIVRDKLLAHRSVFTPGRSTIERIITLNTVIQSRKEARDFSFRGLFGLLSSISRLFLIQLIIRPCESCYTALVRMIDSSGGSRGSAATRGVNHATQVDKGIDYFNCRGEVLRRIGAT